MRARPLAVVTVTGAALVLTACGSSGGGGGGSTTPPSSQASSPSSVVAAPSSAPASTTATSSSSQAAAGAAKPVPVNKSFADPVMGEKGTVLSYIRDYQVPANIKQKYSALADEEVVLVQVRVTASSKYYDSLGPDSFYLTGTANGIDEGSTSILDGVIGEQSHLQALKPADTGKTTTGWVVFTPKKGLKKLTLRFLRLAATTSNGKSIPRKNFDIPLSN